MKIEKKENIGWIDLLRVIACFLVVLAHCCDPFVGQFDNDRMAFLTGVLTGSSVRACVPLFVMMTGVLLLPVHVDMGSFYKKRIGRMVAPLIFWSVALPVSYFVYLNYIIPVTHSPLISMENYTLGATWNKIYTFIFNFNYDTTPLWYLYMLVGLYFIIPIISSWLAQASRKNIRLFLFVWGFSLFLPYVKMVASLFGYTGIFGVCDWNEYGTFYYASGFIGYLILAYYLVKYPLAWSWKKMLSITVPMYLVGYLVTSVGFILTQKYSPGNYADLEKIWYFSGINVFMMTFAIFVIVQKLKISSMPWLSRVASYTFGIYLCHFVIIQVVFDVLNSIYQLPAIVQIIIISIFTFFISYLIVRGLAYFKLTRRLVM